MNSLSLRNGGWILLAAAATLLVRSTQADTPTFVLGTVSTNQPFSFTGTKGWQFVHSAIPTDIYVTQLGVFDSGEDGLVSAHQIGLWRQAGDLAGTLLASATVPAGTAAPLVGGYRWVPIPPVVIPAAPDLYVIGAQYSVDDADDLVTPIADILSFAPEISPVSLVGRAAFGPDLPFPAGIVPPPCEGCLPRVFWEPNFQYTVVSEPSAVWLVAAASFCFLVRYRRALVSQGRRT